MADSYNFPLRKPIKTHGGEISELTLKAPSAGTFVRSGMPFTAINSADGSYYIRVEPEVMIKFISDMSGLDEIVLSGIDGRDAMPLFWSVVNFLGEPVAPSTSTL
jgi:hypothetical protein